MNVGGQNSSIYDTSDTWSDDLSSLMEHTIILLLQMHLMEVYQMDLPSIHLAITQQFVSNLSPITVNTQIRIYVFDYNGSNVTYQYRVNDGSWSNMPGTSSPYLRWQDFTFTGLTSFEYRSNTSITYKPYLCH